jgi:hypothetical protein
MERRVMLYYLLQVLRLKMLFVKLSPCVLSILKLSSEPCSGLCE